MSHQKPKLRRPMAWLMASMVLAGAAMMPVSALAQEAGFATGAVNLIGWDGAAPGGRGALRLGEDGLEFRQDGVPHRIGWNAVRRFAIEKTSRGLIRGTGGMMASFAPQGAGQLYSAIRPGAQALSLLYADGDGGLHAAVLLLPQGSRDAVLTAFARAGLRPSALLTDDVPDGAQPEAGPDCRHLAPAAGGDPGALLVLFPQAATQEMPAAYAAEVYEQTIAQMDKARRFDAVWRDGDQRAGACLATLSTTITHVRKGNAGMRGAIPVLGMVIGKTVIRADVRLSDAQGKPLLETTLTGSRGMPGESIGASKGLARSLTRSMRKTALAQSALR